MNALVTKKSYAVISNVVDTSLFNYSPAPPASNFQFIHVSNMIPLKNTRGIIEAAAELKKNRSDFKVLLVGNIKEEYHELARQLQLLDTVIFFKGILPYKQIAKQIAAAHALIIFSDTESQSCVVLEALCSGRPAIVTNTGGVKELIHEDNGFKVQVRDTGDLVQKMNDMIEQYPSFDLEKISREAISNYSYDAVGRQFFELYLKVNS
jgi:glycosyltransferase involved in cell wall biosynthesis